MKIRVISDLHLDVNGDFCYKIPSKKYFTIIAGDLSGNPETGLDWISKNVTEGIFVAGNHLVYNKKDKTIRELKEELHKRFPLESKITFLDNEVGIIEKNFEGFKIVGSCLYTDYKLNVENWKYPTKDGETLQEWNMRMAVHPKFGMNDFRWGLESKTYPLGMDNEPSRTFLTPKYYLDQFNETFEKIDKIVTDNEKESNPKPIILVTHHPISTKAIYSSYIGDMMNASYVSDLDDWIVSHPSIRCICSGHVHSQNHFKIERPNGQFCSYILNPRGYERRGEGLGEFGHNVNTFIDTDTWEVEITPKSKSKIAKDRKRLDDFIRTYAAFF